MLQNLQLGYDCKRRRERTKQWNSALATYHLGFAQARPVAEQVGSKRKFENQAKEPIDKSKRRDKNTAPPNLIERLRCMDWVCREKAGRRAGRQPEGIWKPSTRSAC